MRTFFGGNPPYPVNWSRNFISGAWSLHEPRSPDCLCTLNRFCISLTIVAAYHAFAENFAKRLDNPLVFCYNTYVVFLQHESLAQAVEHLTFNQGVPGSIPGWFTTNQSALLSHLWLTGRFLFN